jgi:predicted nucleotidyltransferase component of viral defense system
VLAGAIAGLALISGTNRWDGLNLCRALALDLPVPRLALVNRVLMRCSFQDLGDEARLLGGVCGAVVGVGGNKPPLESLVLVAGLDMASQVVASRFILKGALLLRVWDSPLGRPTMDIDLLGMTANDLESIGRQVREVLEVKVEPDGLEFDSDTIEVQRIAEAAAYHGVRVRVLALLAGARIRLQVDIGFGDPVHPASVLEEFPTLLKFPAARLMCYSRESVVAEKFEAMVRHGELNSRMKDFYDVWLLSRSFDFKGLTLEEAIRRTFASRDADVAGPIAAFSEDFAEAKELQWTAFVRRIHAGGAPSQFVIVVRAVALFLAPVAAALATGVWSPAGTSGGMPG